MGFGGAVSGMIASIKSNARPKRKTYFERDSNSGGKTLITDKKATPEQLEKIRKQMLKDNRRRILVLAIIGLSVFSLVVAFFMFGRGL